MDNPFRDDRTIDNFLGNSNQVNYDIYNQYRHDGGYGPKIPGANYDNSQPWQMYDGDPTPTDYEKQKPVHEEKPMLRGPFQPEEVYPAKDPELFAQNIERLEGIFEKHGIDLDEIKRLQAGLPNRPGFWPILESFYSPEGEQVLNSFEMDLNAAKKIFSNFDCDVPLRGLVDPVFLEIVVEKNRKHLGFGF